MKKKHKTCRLVSDADIMVSMMENGIPCRYNYFDAGYLLKKSGMFVKKGFIDIETSELKKRLKRQGVRPCYWRRNIKKYLSSLDVCQSCHEYIGEYPNRKP